MKDVIFWNDVAQYLSAGHKSYKEMELTIENKS
jgi:hypothetical protein